MNVWKTRQVQIVCYSSKGFFQVHNSQAIAFLVRSDRLGPKLFCQKMAGKWNRSLIFIQNFFFHANRVKNQL